jgi:YegS/Rv2252/BmrU family lipid kinase
VSVTVIINPISGGGSAAAARRKTQLALSVVGAHGDRPEVLLTERVGHARELAASALQRGARLVIAWGGDGTINEVASALVFGEVPLGIVPSGSGNGLARELGVARRAERAIADALAAEPRLIDVGEIAGHYFVNLAGVGFDAHIASRFAESTRRGFLGYAGITMRALRSYVPLTYRITHDGASEETSAILVTIANSAQFGNGALIAPGARVDDGELDLVVVQERSRLRTICHVPRLFTGTVDRIVGCRMARVRDVTIEADVPLTYHVDGEPVQGGTRLRVRIHPGALRVAVK